MQSHPEVIDVCARLFRILDVNQAAMALYGAKDKHELIGANLDKILPVDSRSLLREELLAIWDDKIEFQSHRNQLYPDGSEN